MFPIADSDSQSPVDIDTVNAEFDENLTIKPLSINYSQEKELTITNTGHSVSAKINATSGENSNNTYCGRKTFPGPENVHIHKSAYSKMSIGRLLCHYTCILKPLFPR